MQKNNPEQPLEVTYVKGAFLDREIQRKLQRQYPKTSDMLSAAGRVLKLARTNPNLLLEEKPHESRKEVLLESLCLLESARAVVGSPAQVEADYSVIGGREYCGPLPKEAISA